MVDKAENNGEGGATPHGTDQSRGAGCTQTATSFTCAPKEAGSAFRSFTLLNVMERKGESDFEELGHLMPSLTLSFVNKKIFNFTSSSFFVTTQGHQLLKNILYVLSTLVWCFHTCPTSMEHPRGHKFLCPACHSSSTALMRSCLSKPSNCLQLLCCRANFDFFLR